MCVKLLGTWRDRDGNLLAEWKWVQLTTPTGNWVVCTSQCKHNLSVTSWKDVQEMARSLIAGGRGTFGAEEATKKEQINAARENAIMIAAAVRGSAPEIVRDQWERAEKEYKANAEKEANR